MDNFKQNFAGLLYPNPANKGDIVYLTGNKKGEFIKYYVYDGLGKLEMSSRSKS